MSTMARQALLRRRTEILDALSFGALGRTLRAIAALVRWQLTFSASRRIARRYALIRLLPPGPLHRLVAGASRREIDRSPASVVRAHAASGTKGLDGRPVTRTTVLKAPGADGERGVIYSAFEYNWVRLVEGLGDLGPLLSRYDVVWATSWSPTNYLDVARVLASSAPDAPIYLQASNFAEVETLRAFHPRIRIVPNLLGEYLDPASFESRPAAARDIDLLVVSNWAPFKRHFELFRALRALPANLRIVCVGQPERGHTLAGIRQLAAAFGVPQAIEYHESLPLAEVRQLQGRSRAAAVFSLREGCCVAAVEALFAGASLGLVEGAQVGSIAFINPETGIVLRRDQIGDDLMRLITDAPNRTPRDWAVAHLGAERATGALNEWLREQARDRGLPWTTDIARMSWSPYPWIGDPAARLSLAKAAGAVHQQFPAVFAADLLDSSRF